MVTCDRILDVVNLYRSELKTAESTFNPGR